MYERKITYVFGLIYVLYILGGFFYLAFAVYEYPSNLTFPILMNGLLVLILLEGLFVSKLPENTSLAFGIIFSLMAFPFGPVLLLLKVYEFIYQPSDNKINFLDWRNYISLIPVIMISIAVFQVQDIREIYVAGDLNNIEEFYYHRRQQTHDGFGNIEGYIYVENSRFVTVHLEIDQTDIKQKDMYLFFEGFIEIEGVQYDDKVVFDGEFNSSYVYDYEIYNEIQYGYSESELWTLRPDSEDYYIEKSEANPLNWIFTIF